MATPEILDIAALTQPISDDNPVGEDLRNDASPTSVYFALKDARSTARAEERSAAMEGESDHVPAAWSNILEMGPEALQEKAKDLEVCAWITEALVRFHGFAGLRDGFRLTDEIIKLYWDDVYPLEDEDGLETKIAPLTGLNGEGADGTLIQPIRQIPLTEPGDLGPMALWHHQQASALSQITDEEKREARIAAGALTIDQFNAAVASTSSDFYVALIEDGEAAVEAFAALDATLTEKCGADGPPVGQIRSALNEVLDLVRYVARDRLPLDGGDEPAEGEDGEAAAAAEGGAPAAGGAAPAAARPDVINNREDAFRLVLKAAEYFRKNEPHSPISFTLEELVRRGRMPLSDLIRELIPDEDARRTFVTIAGMRNSIEQPDEE